MSVIDDYLKTVSPAQKAELERVRKIIKKAIPGAEEVISYGIPAFKYQTAYVIGFAAYKDHLSLFPSSEPIEILKSQLSAFNTSKGTVQFTLGNPVPTVIINKLIAIRVRNITRYS